MFFFHIILFVFICLFFIYFLFDFCLFFIQPYLAFFKNLGIGNYLLRKQVFFIVDSFEKKNNYKVFINIKFNTLKSFFYVPDYLYIDNNPIFSYVSYFLILLYFVFFFSFISISFSIYFNKIKLLLLFLKLFIFFLFYHYYLIPLKLYQLTNDFLELETSFNLQFSLNYYLSFYFILFFFLLIITELIIFFFRIKKFKLIFNIFFMFLFVFSFDPLNFFYFSLNINWFFFIYYYIIYICLIELFLNLFDFINKLEMTGIEPA